MCKIGTATTTAAPLAASPLSSSAERPDMSLSKVARSSETHEMHALALAAKDKTMVDFHGASLEHKQDLVLGWFHECGLAARTIQTKNFHFSADAGNAEPPDISESATRPVDTTNYSMIFGGDPAPENRLYKIGSPDTPMRRTVALLFSPAALMPNVVAVSTSDASSNFQMTPQDARRAKEQYADCQSGNYLRDTLKADSSAVTNNEVKCLTSCTGAFVGFLIVESDVEADCQQLQKSLTNALGKGGYALAPDVAGRTFPVFTAKMDGQGFRGIAPSPVAFEFPPNPANSSTHEMFVAGVRA